MSTPFPKIEIRSALKESLPENDCESSHCDTEVVSIYVPPSHARALDPNHTLVEGIRGAGKSFWWRTLHSTPHRQYLALAFPETKISDTIQTSQGFGLSNQQCLDVDILGSLVKKLFEPRQIWRAVIATHLKFPPPFPLASEWSDRVAWVADQPEKFNKMLYQADENLALEKKTHLILFDALDRLAETWSAIRPLAKALLQVALDLRSCRNIRAKLFLRPDMLEDREICAFPDASKLLSQKISLTWSRADLYALLFQCLGNAKTGGEVFRAHCKTEFSLEWEQKGDAWILPFLLRTDEEMQRSVFHAIAGPRMAMSEKSKLGFPYTWLVSHLMDGREQVSPRSYFAALRQAVEYEPNQDWSYSLHFKGIRMGIQAASRIRVDEIMTEDYPWIQILMEPLRGKITVPCEKNDILTLWHQNQTLDKLKTVDKQGTKLPPRRLDEGAEGILQDIEELGLIKPLLGERIQMPDIYRTAFGFGRRGGVKPLK